MAMKSHFRKCFVPKCSNNSVNCPDRGFVTVPRKLERRSLWFNAVSYEGHRQRELYCCEDHFEVRRDFKDYEGDKQRGSRLSIKAKAVPTAFLCNAQDNSSSRSHFRLETVIDCSVAACSQPHSTVTVKDEPDGGSDGSMESVLTVTVKEEPDSEAELDEKTATVNPSDDDTDGTVLNIDQVRSHFRLEVTEVNIPREQLIPVPKSKQKKQYMCQICGKEFGYKATLQNHLIIHSGERAYQCDVCGATFALKITLTTHLMSHLDIKPYKCKYCQRRFISNGFRNRHERTHTGESSFKCKTCESIFPSIRERQQHIRDNPNCRRWPCTKCNIDFPSRNARSAHNRVHFICQMCSLPLVSKYALKRHISIVHTKDDSSHECHVCHKKFHREYLKKHLLSHIGAMLECNVCHKKFKWYSSLCRHKRTFHSPSGQIIYECDHCVFKCKSKRALEVHMRMHSGATFDCGWCNRKFLTDETLESHMRRHTGKRLKCLKCGNGFSSKRCLLLHVKQRHGYDPDVYVLMR